MKKIKHYYSLTSEWLLPLAEAIGAKVINNKIIVIPEQIGCGHIYFAQVAPGISSLFFDAEFSTEVKITRLPSENQIYIFHYDLSKHINLIKINNINYEIGSFDKLDLAVIDNNLKSSFKPAINERTTALRLLVDKSLLNEFTKTYNNKKVPKNLNKSVNKTFYHYGNIDSNSLSLILSLKNKLTYDLSFDSLLRGISLRLLGNFLNKFYDSKTAANEITDLEIEAIIKTKNYLFDNLYGRFPSITFLSALAGMSDTKYKTLFKKYYGKTPYNFFIVEKMIIARKNLQSGEFHTLTSVANKMNYHKLNHFCSKYYDVFQRKPSDDFKKSSNHTKHTNYNNSLYI